VNRTGPGLSPKCLTVRTATQFPAIRQPGPGIGPVEAGLVRVCVNIIDFLRPEGQEVPDELHVSFRGGGGIVHCSWTHRGESRLLSGCPQSQDLVTVIQCLLEVHAESPFGAGEGRQMNERPADSAAVENSHQEARFQTGC